MPKKYVEAFVEKLVDDPVVIKQLQKQFDCDKSIATLKRLTLLPALRILSLDKEVLKAAEELKPIRDELARSMQLLNIDTKFSMLKGVSVLELALIVVMLEMNQNFPEQPFNFDLILNAYYKFCQKRNWGQQKHEKQIVLKVN